MLGNPSKRQLFPIMGIQIFYDPVDSALPLALLRRHHSRLRLTDAVQPDQQLNQQGLQIRLAPQ
ncbi:hypothetical protein D3C75_903750 [compost metagenome]